MTKHGLTSEQIAILIKILHPYADKIKIVGLFGSRAQGTYRPSSDLDMAIDGDLTESDIDRLYTLFDESLLPFKVDVNALNLIGYSPLRNHIEAVFYPLLSKEDLKEGLANHP